MSEGATNLRKNALLVGVAQLLSRVTGLLREVAFAAAFGAGIQADAYNTAFRIGSLFRELFAEGALANAFVPLYADVDEKDGRAAALKGTAMKRATLEMWRRNAGICARNAGID